MKYLELNFHLQPSDEAASDVLAALLADVGGETFLPTDEGLKAYIQQDNFSEAALQEALGNFRDIFPQTAVTYSCCEAPDENWNATWEAEHHFEPISLPNGEQFQIVPRQAFGSGEHATTRMMLQLLATTALAGKTVIDAGCGTGVLGIAALKLGARHVFAYDIDEWSVKNSEENFTLNGLPVDGGFPAVTPAVTPSVTPAVTLALGNAETALPAAPEADVLLANINRNILLADLPAFSEKLPTGGLLLLSGFLEADIPALRDAANALGFSLLQTLTDGDWRALKFQKS